MDTSSSSKTTSSVSRYHQLHDPAECRRIPILLQRTSFVLPIRRRASQRVRFAPLVSKDTEADSTNVFASPHEELTEDLIQATWYSKKDILTFQKRAKLMMLLKAKYPSLPEESKLNESAMGLDRFNPKRTAYKRAAMKFTLQAQQKTNGNNPEFVAAVAKQCSSWARSAAIHQALQNYCDVYNSSRGGHDTNSLCAKVKQLQNQESSLAITSKVGKMGTKRSFEGDIPEPAQKRRRVARSA